MDFAPTDLTPNKGLDNRGYDNFGDDLEADDSEGGKKKSSGGCWNTFARGVRGIWATKQTEDAGDNQELRVKTTLRELIIYCIFLAVLCIITFGMANSNMYYYTNVLNNLFTQTGSDDGSVPSFVGISLPGDFLNYVEFVLLPVLYTKWEKWYNNQPMSKEIFGNIYYENKLQGIPRLRQIRVRNDSCSPPSEFRHEIFACYADYSSGNEEKRPFGKGFGSAWTHSDEGSSVTAQMNSYGGGGFHVNLNTTLANTLPIVHDLRRYLWIDRSTRAVFIDFTVYNANINLFCVIKLIAEFPPTGGIIPSFEFRTVKLLRYNTHVDMFVMACEFVFCLFILYYIGEEFLEIKKLKWSYMKEVWNVLDLIVLAISLCCIGFNVYRFLAVRDLMTVLLLNPENYIDFDFISKWQAVFNSALAIMVFFAWIKIFKYISFNKTMTQLSSTLGACAKDLGGFAIMFFIVFLAFAQLGYLLFSTQVADFNAYESAIFTLFRIILGDFNFDALRDADAILGPTYFILYVFFVFFILLNMFLAIINDTYSEVKAELAGQPNDIDVAGFFKVKFNSVLEKLNLKKKKIVAIQNAILNADINGDNMIDFDEWRHNLKMQGYAEAEIEAVFSKYDVDGDRLLNEEELIKMQQDLEGQKNAINDDINKMNGEEAEEEEKDAESFEGLQTKVDGLEGSVGNIVTKIDALLGKLEQLEKVKLTKRQEMKNSLGIKNEDSVV